MNTQEKSRSSPGYLRRGDKGAICEQKHQDEREEMEGPERKRRSDHLGHSCSRLGKGHRSDQQMQTVSPQLSGFSALLTRQVLRRQLRDAPQTHLLSLVFVFSRAAIAKYHKMGGLTEMYCLMVREVRSLEPRRQQGVSILSSVREGSISDRPLWLVDGHLLPVSLYIVFPPCASVSESPLVMRNQPYWIRAHPNNLILT